MKLKVRKTKRCILLLLMVFATAITYAQTKSVSGTISDESGSPLPGATILEKGTTNGTISNAKGKFSITVPEDAILVVSFIGFKTQEIIVEGKTVIDVTMNMDSESLDVIVVTGIRAAEARAIETKKMAVSVVESISPQDLGNFSDENVADALKRVPGVQIQEDQTGGQDGGARISIRGIGPAFVQTTINGRQPLSSGVEGVGSFRQFNLNVLPPEVINGALVYKTSEAGLVEPGLGGLVDFQTLKPLEMRYKNGKNTFGSINVRGELDGHDRGSYFTPTPRISGIFGAKTKNNKFGGYVSVLWSDLDRSRDQVFNRSNTTTVREDTNGNGVWDGADGGDTELASTLYTQNTTHNAIDENQERLAMSAALQWKPAENLTFTADAIFTRFDNNSDRTVVRPLANQLIPNTVLAAGNMVVEDGFLKAFDTDGAFNYKSGASDEGGSLAYSQFGYDNLADNLIGGFNVKWEPGDWTIIADYSYSEVTYFQQQANYGRTSLGQNISLTGSFAYDGRDGIPQYTLPTATQEEWLDAFNYEINAPDGFHMIRHVNGINNAFRFDINRKINDKLNLDFGARFSSTEYLALQVTRNKASGYVSMFYDDDGNTKTLSSDLFNGYIDNFLPGTGFSLIDKGFPTLDRATYQAQFPELFEYDVKGYPLFNKNTSVFDIDEKIEELQAEGTDDYFRRSGTPFGLEELTSAYYTQLNLDTKIGNVPLTGNVGLRVVRTEYTGEALGSITLRDPASELGGSVSISGSPATVNNARWDVLPTLNFKLKFTDNFHYRGGIVKTMTRPAITDLRPSGSISGIATASSEFESNGGTAKIPNLDIKPFTVWQYDNTFELYNKYGAVFVSAFYKDISNYILSGASREDVSFEEVVEEGGFDTDAMEAAGIYDDLAAQTYTVTQPQNVGNANVFGLEVGFSQRLGLISSALKNFGWQANYNFITSSFDNDEINDEDVFPGTSRHSLNSVLYFENDKFAVRAAYTVRSTFLRTLKGSGLNPLVSTWTVSRSQLDLRASYNIIENMQLSVSAVNITGSDQKSIYNNDPTLAHQYISLQPIVTMGLRYAF